MPTTGMHCVSLIAIVVCTPPEQHRRLVRCCLERLPAPLRHPRLHNPATAHDGTPAASLFGPKLLVTAALARTVSFWHGPAGVEADSTSYRQYDHQQKRKNYTIERQQRGVMAAAQKAVPRSTTRRRSGLVYARPDLLSFHQGPILHSLQLLPESVVPAG